MSQELLGAFVPETDVRVAGSADGPLAGLTFAVKDLFDVEGHVTGCGNPDWAASHPPAERHAWAVQVLLDAGAGVAGKTITDEISLGLLESTAIMGRRSIRRRLIWCPVDRPADRPRRSPAVWWISRWVRIPAGRSGRRRVSAGCTGCVRPMAAFPSPG